jgi:DNA helicase IV
MLGDVPLLDEARVLLGPRPRTKDEDETRTYGHIVVDEAQDLSPMQLRAVGRRCSTGSMTVLGDIAQGTTPWATPSWEVTLEHLGQPAAVIDVLDRGFRVPAAVIEYAARLLPSIAPGLTPPTSVRDDPGSLSFVPVRAEKALWPALVDAVRKAMDAEGSVGVIVPDAWIARATKTVTDAGIAAIRLGPGAPGHEDDDLLNVRVSVIPATTAKGLEYDRVIVLEPTAIAEAEPDERTGLRRLYVVLTRAVTGLTVIHHRDLPDLLS